MIKSINILQSSTGMNNACRSHCRSNSLSLYSTSFGLKEQNLKCFGGQHDSLSLLGSRKGLLTGHIIKRKFVVCNNGQPGVPLPSPPSSNPFNGWLIGVLLSAILPFFRYKWGSLLHLKNKVENIIQTVEEVVENVEELAGKADKLAENMGNDLPAGQLKNALKAVENFSEEAAQVARATDDLIDKMQGDYEEREADGLPKEQLKDAVENLSEKTAKVAHAAEDLKNNV
ncbi:uncharacterized protein LOC132035373 [Lycium ferocissimum]|uniref:uncharacterized protein LOC132035373 n=1 Tax=Lycium ferocissimum TaxID=112874 RepID=UPI002815274F|nr:uncharacterized protein LOC132035373 [Lycium ferocissimum]